jgi:hypothetical protein
MGRCQRLLRERHDQTDCLSFRHLLRRRAAPGAARISAIQQFVSHVPESGGGQHGHLEIVPGRELGVGNLVIQRTEERTEVVKKVEVVVGTYFISTPSSLRIF